VVYEGAFPASNAGAFRRYIGGVAIATLYKATGTMSTSDTHGNVKTRHPRITRTRTGAWMSNPAAASQSSRICNHGTRRERRNPGTRSGCS